VKFAALCLAVFALAGCSKNIDTPDAVKQGVIKDIAKKVDVQNMDVNVDSVSFRDKEATANVSFRPKGGDPAQSITMNYTMERQGDEWHVKDRNMKRQQAAPGEPPAHGQVPLPPGHQPIDGTTGTMPLPPGHPPTTTSPKP
jgi:hypothetical protein